MHIFLEVFVLKRSIFNYFSKFELWLWLSSVALIISSFLIFDRGNYLALLASLIGVTSLVLCAKGNPLGQVLIIIFSIMYGYISFTCAYYGEMLTYVCMTGPMAVYALIEWLRHPYEKSKSEVKVNRVSPREIALMFVLAAAVTVIFYFVLKYFNTSSLFFSTISVTTSFAAVYLTARRSPYYAVAYALNDIVLIVLWTIATISNISYVSVIICFVVFLANDVYGFYAWRKMQARQAEKLPIDSSEEI